MRKRDKTSNVNRFAELAKLGEVVFHTSDLANLWRISNKNTLYTTIRRYTQNGLIYRIHKGFYAIKDPKTIDPLLVGAKSLHGTVYVSTETILAEAGIIQQHVPAITLVSSCSKRFSCAGISYYSRQLADAYLYHPASITTLSNGVRKASTERAVADLLYFNQHAYFDAEKSIDWKKVRVLQEAIGYPLTPKRYV